ncbi:MAG: hypothetical protein UX13_C0005G0004 [Candidatus Woesebacteria bacterium GW2011_GWB1_45_5]|uniref:DUF5667 domain-containing protein n=1 Tax=Candidatus Woesebacteria bacterium GW2011_GWB1_45_5 TaxID=1618581 RepID=A0A0G1MQS7_9BACT|nr:MAG: hypothetical protein UX13_C0005G0004 [Candidatus Woesebacteria bacterium GW2011_GWB1_45_5]
MKKAAIITTILLSILFLPAGVGAQDFNFEKAYQDYVFTQGQYRNAYSDYEKAKDFYLKNQTLTLKEEARKKTLTMLRERDQMETVYLTALRLKILEIRGLTGDQKNAIFGKIDTEVAWYQDHKAGYNDGASLEDLFNKSKEPESRYKTHTLPLIYESLFIITLGEQKTIGQDQENIYSALRTTIDENVKTGKLDMNPFNHWFSDIDLIIKNLTQNEERAKTQIQKVYGQTLSPVSSYNTSLTTLSSSLNLLGQLNQFLIEVLTSIRNQI